VRGIWDVCGGGFPQGFFGGFFSLRGASGKGRFGMPGGRRWKAGAGSAGLIGTICLRIGQGKRSNGGLGCTR